MSSQYPLLPYIGFAGDPEQGAVLVFARNAREARPLAFRGVNGWIDVDYTDIRVRRLREHLDYLYTLADADRLQAGRAHVLDDLPSCPSCETWGAPLTDDARACARCVGEGGNA